MPLYTPLSSAIPTGPSTTAPTAGASGNPSRGDHAHPFYTALPSDHGLIAWSYQVDLATSTTIPTAGTVQVVKVFVPVAATITNVCLYLSTGSTGASNCYAALYNGSKSLLSQTADQATNWNAGGGTKVIALSASQAVTAGAYYVAFWYGATTTTGPSFLRNPSGGHINFNLTAANSRFATADTSITTTAPPTLGTFTANNFTFWVGLS